MTEYEGICRGGPRDGQLARFYMKREGFFTVSSEDGFHWGNPQMLGWYNFNPDNSEFVWEAV